MKWKDLKFWHSQDHRKVLWRTGHRDDVLPPEKEWFNAFTETPFEETKAVILGQDPYPTPGQAHGLAFSVRPGVHPHPRSLANVFKEYANDLGYKVPRSGCLLPWARRGVLLLNSVLTVERGKPGSHQGWGWEKLTTEVIKKLSEKKESQEIVFIFWGRKAQEYAGLVDTSKHLVIEAPHPSPLSANKGFFGHRPFTRTNDHLLDPIDWRL